MTLWKWFKKHIAVSKVTTQTTSLPAPKKSSYVHVEFDDASVTLKLKLTKTQLFAILASFGSVITLLYRFLPHT